MEEIIKRYLRKIYYNLKTCALWLFMAVLTGVAVGAFSSAFLLKKSNHTSRSISIFVIFSADWWCRYRIFISSLWGKAG